MGKVISWIVVIICLYLVWQAGVFDIIGHYFKASADKANREEVIYNPDGSVTTVRYNNVLNVFFDRNNGR